MTAPVLQAQFNIPAADTPMQAAAMWRGAMIDRFARLEATALECIRVLFAGARHCPKSYVAWERFRLLRQALNDERLAAAQRTTVKLLDKIESERDLRIGLAHGILRANKSGVTLKWSAWQNSRWVDASIHHGWLQTLETLKRVDKLQRDFSSQAGQIRKLVAAQKD